MIDLERKPSVAKVEELRQSYFKYLSGHVEPYIEELVSYNKTIHLIRHDGELIGYCCITPKKSLIQFHISPEYVRYAAEAFWFLVSNGHVERAFVLTKDPLCLSLSMDLHKTVSVHCYLFEDGGHQGQLLSGFDRTVFRAATPDDVPVIRDTVEDFHDFLHYTLETSVERGEIFTLFSENILLGTGVISGQDSLPPYVDIGMCVNEAYRRKNVGTYIVMKLIEYCREMGWIAGASCQFSNAASKRTLEKAGMVARDRVLQVEF